MRYNAEIQTVADAYAKKHGYFCAVYLGPTDDGLVFQPRYVDNEPKCTGLQKCIIYKNDKFRLVRGLNYLKYTKRLHYTHFPLKGKVIFDIYKQMNDTDTSLSNDDMTLIREIVAMSWGGGFNIPVPVCEIYEALEIADRLCMTIEFFPNEQTTDRCDGWEYFIRIIPGKLPERIKLIID